MIRLHNLFTFCLYLAPLLGLRMLGSLTSAIDSKTQDTKPDDEFEFPTADPGTLKSRLTFKSGGPLIREQVPSFAGPGDSLKTLGSKVLLPDFLRSIYSRAATEGKLTTPYDNVNEIKIYPDKSGVGNKYTFSFAITELESHESIIAIELRFFTKSNFWTYGKRLIHVYQVVPSFPKPQNSKFKKELQHYFSIYLTSVTVNYLTSQQHVVKIDQSLLMSEETSKKQKVRLVLSPDELPVGYIENTNHHTNREFHASIFRNHDDAEWSQRSLIAFYLRDELNVVDASEAVVYPTVLPLVDEASEHKGDSELRTRRSSFARRPDRPCRLVPFIANFTEIGWTKEFVIGPETFEMNLCMGDCPWPNDQRFNATNHAIMQGTFSAFQSYAGKVKVPQPCCVPDKLMPLPLLYMEPSQNVILKTFRDMVAAHCGCY